MAPHPFLAVWMALSLCPIPPFSVSFFARIATGPQDFLIGVSSLCRPSRSDLESPLSHFPSESPDTEPTKHWVGGGRGQSGKAGQAIGPRKE